MTIIGEIVELTNQAYKIWSVRRAENSFSPQELYVKFIEPSYKLLKEVHTDYLELYLELQERIALENSLSNETIRWFSKARSRRQMDRSELKSLEIPPLDRKLMSGVNDSYLKDLNLSVGMYLSSLRDYFLPERRLRTSGIHRLFDTDKDQILSTRLDTHSLRTEAWLMRMYLWLELPHEEKIVLLAEEYLRAELEKSSTPLVRDELIEGIFRVVNEPNSFLASELEQLLVARSERAKGRIRDQHRDEKIPRGIDDDIKLYLGHLEELPNWRRIVDDHIWTERKNLEESIGRVQYSFIRIRILSDR